MKPERNLFSSTTSFHTMNYTVQELEVFQVCFALAAQGCKTDHEIQKGVYRTVWWISPLQTQKLVKLWIRDRLKIEAYLASLNGSLDDLVRHVENDASQGTRECGDSSCASSQSI